MEFSNDLSFKRTFYYDVKESVLNNHATMLLGARKCGKSVCLKQLEAEISNAEYYDLKITSDDETDLLLDKILQSIENSEDKIYLLDEATYFFSPESDIAKIAAHMRDYKNTDTHVIFAGSQSAALEIWCIRAFAGNINPVKADFLSYPEWLAYYGIEEVSEKTYNKYLLGSMDFYSDFTSLDAYLQGCLDETILSNYKTKNIIFNNSCEEVNVNVLKNILYAALISEANRPDISNFFDKNSAFREIRDSFSKEVNDAGKDVVQKRLNDIFSQRLTGYSALSMEAFRQSLIFLYRSGLITLTHISDETKNFENIIDVYSDLQKNYNPQIKNKQDLFTNVNICIKHPFFFAEIIKDSLGNNMPSEIKGSLLGSMVECHVRGLLTEESSFEFHDFTRGDEKEIDYVNYASKEAVEVSVSNKSNSEVWFDELPKDFKRILLTKNQEFIEKSGITRIPYYKFIFDYSDGAKTFVLNNMKVKYAETNRVKVNEPDNKKIQKTDE